MNFFLSSNNVISISDVENVFPWERDVYFNQYKNKLEEQKDSYA
jgi:hypothetical protein